MELCDVAVFFQFLFCFFKVVLFFAQEVKGLWIVLEDVGADTEAYSSAATCYDVDLEWYDYESYVVDSGPMSSYLARQVWNGSIGIEVVA